MIRFGPAGLGSVKNAKATLEDYKRRGFRACEIAFVYGVYIKKDDASEIGKIAKENKIRLSIHAPFYINLNSDKKQTIESSKKRIIECCEIGEILGAEAVVFHPGFYGKDKEKAYDRIRDNLQEVVDHVKKKGWKIKLAPETMGKVNVFGSVEEISRLVKDTGCSFCIDFAHILARDKKIDYEKIIKLFPSKEWHVHFSGIIYGEKGEKMHKKTEKSEWKELLANIPDEKEVVIINESPDMIEDCEEGIQLYSKK